MPVETTSGPQPTTDTSATARRISQRLATRIGPKKYDKWFARTKVNVDGRCLEVATDSPFVARWIDSHFGGDLRGVAKETLGDDARIDVRVAPEMFAARSVTDLAADDPATATPSRRHGGPQAPHDRVGPDRRPGRRVLELRHLDEFIVGQSNRLAYSAACRLTDEQETAAVSPLFIHGDCGLGKTHLLQGICRRFAELTGRPQDVRYVTGEQFTNEFIACIRSNDDSLEAFRRRIRKLDLLAIDDVHFLSNKVRTQSEFLYTLDAIGLTGARVVLASDEHPRLIKKFSQALISRFLSGMVVEIERPDRDTRLTLIRRLAGQRQVVVTDSVVEAIASRCVGSVRELEGAVTKLAALHSLRADRAPTTNGQSRRAASEEAGMLLIDQLFREHGWRPPTPVRIGAVVDVVCQRLGVTRADLMGAGRHRRVVLARGLVAYLGRELTTLSYPELARALGRAYHSTIHTAEQRLRRQMSEGQIVDPGDASRPIALRELVDQLRHEITRAAGRR